MSITKNDMFAAWCEQSLLAEKNSSVVNECEEFFLRMLNLNNDNSKLITSFMSYG